MGFNKAIGGTINLSTSVMTKLLIGNAVSFFKFRRVHSIFIWLCRWRFKWVDLLGDNMDIFIEYKNVTISKYLKITSDKKTYAFEELKSKNIFNIDKIDKLTIELLPYYEKI